MRLLSCLAALLPGPLLACDLALALAVDVSGSVDPAEYRLQRDGLAAALRDPVIGEALVRARARLMVVQWTGAGRQKVTVPWVGIGDFEDVEAFAARVAADRRVWRNFATAIGEALLFTAGQFPPAPRCKRRLIDVSGDGVSNEGVPPGEVRARLAALDISVNALAIEAREPELTAYFFEHVIRGEGAFVVTAARFADYPARIRLKLLREVTLQTAAR